MDILKRKQLLSDLEKHLFDIKEILQQLQQKDLLITLNQFQLFIGKERKKLSLEDWCARVDPFLNLQAKNESAKVALTLCQKSLQEKLIHLPEMAEPEKDLQPYIDLLSSLQCHDPVQRTSYLFSLAKVFPKDFLAYTLMSCDICLPDSCDSNLRDQEASSPANINEKETETILPKDGENKEKPDAEKSAECIDCGINSAEENIEEDNRSSQKKTEETNEAEIAEGLDKSSDESEIPEEVSDFFTSSMFLSKNYKYGEIKQFIDKKSEKNSGVSQLKSDISKHRFAAEMICVALQILYYERGISEERLQIQVDFSNIPQDNKRTIDSALLFLQKNGYLIHYVMTDKCDCYLPSQRLVKLYQQQGMRQYLRVKASDTYHVPAWPKELKEMACTLACLRVQWKCMRDLKQEKVHYKSHVFPAGFVSLINGPSDSYVGMLGFFDTELASWQKGFLEDIEHLLAKDSLKYLIIVGMERSTVESFYCQLQGLSVFPNISIHYFILGQAPFYDTNWQVQDNFLFIDDKSEDAENNKNDKIDESSPKEDGVREPVDTNHSELNSCKNNAVEDVKKEALEETKESVLCSDNYSKEEGLIPLKKENPVEPIVTFQPSKVFSFDHESVLNRIIETINKGGISSAVAGLNYCRQESPSFSEDYQRLAYAVNDPANCLKYTSESVYNLFAGTDSCIDQYLEIAATCRTFFYDDIQYDHMAHPLHDMCVSTGLLITPLTDFLYRLLKFKDSYHQGVDAFADFRRKNQKELDEELARLSQKATEEYSASIEKRISENKSQKRFIETKKIIFNPRGEIAGFLKAVEGNDTGMISLLEDYLHEYFIPKTQKLEKQNISNEMLDRFIDDNWDKAASCLKRVEHSNLMGSLRSNLSKILQRIIDVFCQWIELNGKSTAGNISAGLEAYQKIRMPLLHDLQSAITSLQKSASGVDEKAGIHILLSCLQELQDRLAGTYNPKDKKYFYLNFLLADKVLLNADYLPDFRHWKHIGNPGAYLEDILSYAGPDTLPSIPHRIQDIFEGNDNYFSACLLDDYLQEQKKGSYIQQKNYDLEKSLEYAHRNVANKHRDFVENLELAQSYGQLDTSRENRKEDILRIVSECYRYALESHNYGIFYQVKMYYEQKIKNDARVRGDVLQKELDEMRTRIDTHDPVKAAMQKENLDHISYMIDKQNYTVAEDLLTRWKEKTSDDDLQFVEKDYLEDYLQNYSLYYHMVDQAGKSLSSLIDSRRRNKEMRGAGYLIDCWITSGKKGRNEDKVKNLLQRLGWQVCNMKKEQSSVESYHITLQKPINGKRTNYKHPIAAFGSLAEQNGFRVACLYGRYDANTLMESFKELGHAQPTIVFLDYALPLAERRHLARKIKCGQIGKNAILVVDRVVIAYLIKNYSETKINRILMLLTVPFSAYQPYVWESANVMPVEMFMGRQAELAEIESDTGANIVYGGRQLGKSALLKMAVRDIDHDENGNRAILIDIKGRDYRDAARHISQELSDQNFFLQKYITGDWDELSRAIRQRLRSEEAQPIPYFLLMLDEADAFIKSCESVNYHPLDAMKEIQQIGMGRFKFVIAGLRNIIRFNRQKALSNNSVLTHLHAMTVKPFSTLEARELLEKPLYYLGIRFSESKDSLIPLILASTNYFPGLIQLYCAKLIAAMAAPDYAGYNESDTPIYEVETEHIKKVLAEQNFREEIIDKFEITLKLGDDKYYYIIALMMAYLYYEKGMVHGYTPEDILSEIRIFELKEFNNFKTEQVAALMEELCELNVFRQNAEGRYLFTRFNFFQMMGDREQVESKIEDIMGDEIG